MDAEGHMVINMGPHHPATHGVLRLATELEGEKIVRVSPEVGYLHSGFEKTGENKRYEKFIPYCDRMDYAAPMSNNLAYVLTVEKLMDVEIPEYAQYARVILVELQRIASHMIWLGTHGMDVSGTGHVISQYCFLMRERILDIFEMVCGARMTTSYFSVGGLRWSLPGAFMAAVKAFLAEFSGYLKDFEALLTNNPLWLSRLKGVGYLAADEAIALGITGPLLRAAGVALDLRKAQPYSAYDDFEFEVPTAGEGDCYARYEVRINELRQSVRIIEQVMAKIKSGPYRTSDRKVALPPREEISTSMESLIHHFKLVTEGYRPPRGHIYQVAENPKGWLGFGLISDGTASPYRLRVRGPSFVNLQATDTMARGGFVADLVTIIGSIDIVLGEVDR
jgi:NADH dehydrogenase I D subunit